MFAQMEILRLTMGLIAQRNNTNRLEFMAGWKEEAIRIGRHQ